MIRVGTLCLLLAPHSRAGQVCTVIGRLRYCSGVYHAASGRRDSPPGWRYYIELASGEASPHGQWAAMPSQLRPLNDPDNAPAADVTRREVVRV